VTIVSNSSPLIALSDIRLLEVLQQLFGQVFIPDAVDREVFAVQGVVRARPAWIALRSVQDTARVAALISEVDPGEAEAIVLAEELGLRLLIDDLPGQRVALARGLKITGTLGLLLDAKRVGRIATIASALQALHDTDFRMSADLADQIRRAAGEL
jgi:predicted nucleic acid-binding protein